MKIQIVTEKEPWEFFLETPKAEEVKDSPENLLAAYHEFLRSLGEVEGLCYICERKFRPRISEDTPQPKAKTPPVKDQGKGKKLDV